MSQSQSLAPFLALLRATVNTWTRLSLLEDLESSVAISRGNSNQMARDRNNGYLAAVHRTFRVGWCYRACC